MTACSDPVAGAPGVHVVPVSLMKARRDAGVKAPCGAAAGAYVSVSRGVSSVSTPSSLVDAVKSGTVSK